MLQLGDSEHPATNAHQVLEGTCYYSLLSPEKAPVPALIPIGQYWLMSSLKSVTLLTLSTTPYPLTRFRSSSPKLDDSIVSR